MPTVDCGHWNRLPHLAGSIVWRSRWGRRFRLPVEADLHRHLIPKTVMHASCSRVLHSFDPERSCDSPLEIEGISAFRGRRIFTDRIFEKAGHLGTWSIPTALHLSAGQLALVGERQIAVADRFTQPRVHQLMDVKPHGLP